MLVASAVVDERPTLWTGIAGTLRRPRATMRALADGPAPGVGLAAVALAGVAWGALCVGLHLGGHAPSFTLLPIPSEFWYLSQAVYVTPVLIGQWLLMSVVAHGLARAVGGEGTLRRLLGGAGLAQALPLALLFLLPDAVVYAALGFDAIAPAMRFYAPLSAATTLALLTFAVSASHRLSEGRALVAALVAFLVQAAAGAPVLR